MADTILPVQAPVSSAAIAPATPQLTLQPGSVISAQVIQLLGNGLAQIAIDGIAIAALSEIPLQAGATLQLAVSQAADGVVKLSVVPTNGAAAAAPSTQVAGAAAATVTSAPAAGVNPASAANIQPAATATPLTPAS